MVRYPSYKHIISACFLGLTTGIVTDAPDGISQLDMPVTRTYEQIAGRVKVLDIKLMKVNPDTSKQ